MRVTIEMEKGKTTVTVDDETVVWEEDGPMAIGFQQPVEESEPDGGPEFDEPTTPYIGG